MFNANQPDICSGLQSSLSFASIICINSGVILTAFFEWNRRFLAHILAVFARYRLLGCIFLFISLEIVDLCTPISCAISVWLWPVFSNAWIWYLYSWVSCLYIPMCNLVFDRIRCLGIYSSWLLYPTSICCTYYLNLQCLYKREAGCINMKNITIDLNNL